jgi:hypothetical protein
MFSTRPVDINWMNTRLCPMPWHTHDQPIRITNPQAKRLPKSYISCTKSPAVDWDYHELKTGHDAMGVVV